MAHRVGCFQSDFREIDVYPSDFEMLQGRIHSIKKNITKGQFKDVVHYLNLQFHLLREDFLVTVRDGIDEYRLNRASSNLDVYEGVQFYEALNRFGESSITIRHPLFRKIVNNEDSKKLMSGSLLIFTRNNFNTIDFLAKVISRKHDGVLIVLKNPMQKIPRSRYTMAECKTFFEPYFQVLSALQGISDVNFPMEKYIIQVNNSPKAPKYLRDPNQVKKYISFQKTLTRLNQAQAEAYVAALTQEFVVIQGPPGTGKTFLGLQIATTLLKNKNNWYRNFPILVISFKNHALDQFLEGLIPTTDRLIRVGGQSKSEELKQFNLQSVKQKVRLENLLSRLSLNCQKKDDFGIMQGALVIGMTTTTAARMRDTLERLKCPIVIVEEAAEVLESHVVASLTTNCQHLILLGDHKQLRPNTSDHTIGTEYHLDLSLFERMVNNGIHCYKLDVQHRMRPTISNLLKLTIYPFLKDHESVKKRPCVSGVDRNVFFIDHEYPEANANFTSKKNTHEALFLIKLAQYLCMNGHTDIVILTTYFGQVEELERVKRISEKRFLADVRISTLDSFQGQEAEIILLSLVRSKAIGFLSKENRICVALSRARNGLYLIGNMKLLSKHSEVWSTIRDFLVQKKRLDVELTLRCQNHPETITKVKCDDNFRNVSFGGCSERCPFRLSCGHKCRYFCHVFDKKHEEYECKVVVQKRFDCGCRERIECCENVCPNCESESECSD